MTDGPHLEACVECWGPAARGVTECDHDEGVHRWQARHATLVVRHPAIPVPLVGRFSFPVTDAQMARYMVRHRRVLRRQFAVDPKSDQVTWWCELDQTPDLEALGLTPS